MNNRWTVINGSLCKDGQAVDLKRLAVHLSKREVVVAQSKVTLAKMSEQDKFVTEAYGNYLKLGKKWKEARTLARQDWEARGETFQ